MMPTRRTSPSLPLDFIAASVVSIAKPGRRDVSDDSPRSLNIVEYALNRAA